MTFAFTNTVVPGREMGIDKSAIICKATEGHQTVPSDWVAATGLRPLILEDPCLVWLRWYGGRHGFEEDSKEYSFLEFIGRKGHEFEAKWVNEVAGNLAVQSLDDDRDVRHCDAFYKTLELLNIGPAIITKAALWWAPEQVYGTADMIAHTAWLYKRFPHLAPDKPEPHHYVILDAKFTTSLDEPRKRTDYLLAATQVRIYSYILGQLQGHMPNRAFLVTRDSPFDPNPVDVIHTMDQPLDPWIAELRDRYLNIKLHGGQWLPWRDVQVAPNFSNHKDEPWHQAKKQIAYDYIPVGPNSWS